MAKALYWTITDTERRQLGEQIHRIANREREVYMTSMREKMYEKD